jgi:hypothetical protein
MAGQKYNKAYEAYQQAVYRDGRNPTFWCSIGVLYFQINQFRDALDAYSRAIRINPYISEVWFDLGSLYESCNNQISDAIDAYARASELDPSNHVISQRLQLLKTAQATGGQLPAAPGPQDVHPTAYASAVVPPSGLTGPPLLLQSTTTSTSSSRPLFRSDSRGPPSGDVHLPPPPIPVGSRSSPGPFRGGPPPPVVLDETRHIPSHTPLAPMDVDRPAHHRDFSGPRDGATRGPAGHQNILLHHPVPQQQVPTDELRSSAVHGPGQHQEYFNRPYVFRPRPHRLLPSLVLVRLAPVSSLTLRQAVNRLVLLNLQVNVPRLHILASLCAKRTRHGLGTPRTTSRASSRLGATWATGIPWSPFATILSFSLSWPSPSCREPDGNVASFFSSLYPSPTSVLGLEATEWSPSSSLATPGTFSCS